MVHNYQKEYKNVRIRQLMENDLESLRNWRNNPENTTYLRQIPYITPQMQMKWFQEYLEDDTEMIFAIDEIEKINGVVGSMSLYNFNGDEAEFGKILIGAKDAHGLNVGVNALNALKKISKEQLYLNKLVLHVYKDNAPAIKVYERAGFLIENRHSIDGKLELTMVVDM